MTLLVDNEYYYQSEIELVMIYIAIVALFVFAAVFALVILIVLPVVILCETIMPIVVGTVTSIMHYKL